MKKIIFTIIFFVILSTNIFAEYDCPFGLVDDPYPGDCNRYVDIDTNEICDHSEIVGESQENDQVDNSVVLSEDDLHDVISGQDLKTKTVLEVANLYGINKDEYAYELSNHLNQEVHCIARFQDLHDNYNLKPSDAKEIAENIYLKNNNLVNNNEIISSSNIDETNVDSGVKLTVLSEKYNFIPLSFIISIIYMISYVLAKKKIFKMVVHKMIWNTILLFSFLISGLLGIFLVMEINYKIMFSFLPFNMLYWHVEFGIVMFLIAVFHILWHWKYFVGMIKKIF